MNAHRTLFLALLTLAGSFTGTHMAKERPEYEVDYVSVRSFAETLSTLKSAAAEENFSILFEIDLQAKLKEKGIPLEPTTVVGVCSGKYSSQAMAEDMRIVSQLPCRISVYERDGRVHVQAMNPKLLPEMYKGKGMAGIAQAVDGHIRTMMTKAAGTHEPPYGP